MKANLPINIEVLKWARTSLGISQEEVAHRLKKNIDEINAWESGETSPTYSQLEKLAHEIYKRPVAVFFFPNAPKEDEPKTDFRTLPDPLAEDLPPQIIRLYRKAKLFQFFLEELYEGAKPVKESLLNKYKIDTNSHLETIIKAIRKELGVSIEDQIKWQSTESAVKEWREAFETNGIFVFKDAFRINDYSGFCLYQKNYPIVFINNSMPDSRQIFTLFHELGHLLFHYGGIDFRNREFLRSFKGHYLNVEMICNRFANEFLVPQEEFDSFEPIISESHFKMLAEHFSVSREVILRNYLNRSLIDASYYEDMATRWIDQAKEKREEKSAGGNYYYTKKNYLGENYINLVYSQYYQNKISVDTVSEYLNVKIRNLPTFEHLVMEGGRL